MKKLKQRSRRTAAAARRPSARGPSILLRRNRQRNNIRSVQFSTTCTAKPFDRKFPAEKLVSGFREEVQLIPIQLLPFVVEEEAQPQEEEEGVQFGDEGGHEPAEPIEQRKRAGGLRREVASLASQLGGYWDVDTSVRRARKKPERMSGDRARVQGRLSPPGQLERCPSTRDEAGTPRDEQRLEVVGMGSDLRW
eukprot:scaffold556_cov144-Skeletonema_menzelii.AAC.13